MAKEMQYNVKGSFEGININSNVQAFSTKQAKLRAGFQYNLGGDKMKSFMKSRKIKIKKIK